MKWINGETWASVERRMAEWHPWFAWYPVVVGKTIVNGRERTVKVWLCMMERRGEYYNGWGGDGFAWEYREIPAPQTGEEGGENDRK